MLVAALEDENEDVVELVAFPKACEKYRDLLRQDALLVVQAKVDERNGVVQLVLEHAAHLDLSAAAPLPDAPEMDLEGLAEEDDSIVLPEIVLHATVPDEAACSSTPSVPATATATPSESTPVEMGATSPSSTPAAPPVTTPISIIKPHATPRLRPSAAPNGNGHDHYPPQINGGSAQGRTMRLRFRRTGDHDSDIRLMQHIYDLLRGRDGSDQVVIQLDTADRRVLLRMRRTITCDDEFDWSAAAIHSDHECVSVE